MQGCIMLLLLWLHKGCGISSCHSHHLHLHHLTLPCPNECARHLRRGKASVAPRCAVASVGAVHYRGGLASQRRAAAAEQHPSAQRAQQGGGVQHAHTCFHGRLPPPCCLPPPGHLPGCHRQAPLGVGRIPHLAPRQGTPASRHQTNHVSQSIIYRA